MLNDLLGILVNVLVGLFDNLLINPAFRFLETALFGSKDPLA